MPGIAEELQQVLTYAKDDECNASNMLSVAVSLLQRGIDGDENDSREIIDPREIFEASLAIVKTVQDILDEKNISSGTVANSRSVGGAKRSFRQKSRAVSRLLRAYRRAVANEVRSAGKGEASRQTIIVDASREYDVISGLQTVVCSREAWINTALRDSDLQSMTKEENASIPMVSQGLPADKCEATRQVIIDGASRKYDSSGGSQQLACGRQAWVNNTLRELGLPPMTEEEKILIPVD